MQHEPRAQRDNAAPSDAREQSLLRARAILVTADRSIKIFRDQESLLRARSKSERAPRRGGGPCDARLPSGFFKCELERRGAFFALSEALGFFDEGAQFAR